MARVNLRAAFMSGLDSPVTAQQVFADRADETSAFQAAISNLEQELDRAAVSPVIDRTQGRRNILAIAIDGDHDASAAAIDEARHLTDEIGYRGGHNLTDVARILLDVRVGDHERARHTLHDLDQRTKISGGNTYWVPIAASWIDDLEPDEVQWPEITWLDGPDKTLRRWARVAR